ncbi:MAG: MATE family efflux transporter [Pseudomonadota bacterium]
MFDKQLNSKIWSIAWPAILANVSIPLLGLVDASLLGHLDNAVELAGVAVGGAALSFFYWGFSFLRMGTTGEVARASGAGTEDSAIDAMLRAGLLALAIGTLLFASKHLVALVGVSLMNPSEEIAPVARRYMDLRLFGAPAVLLTYVVVGWFIGKQNTRWPLAIVAGTNLMNILLDFVFIIGLELASAGAAYATVLSEYFGLFIALIGLGSAISKRLLSTKARVFDRNAYKRLLRSNLEIMLRTLALLFAFAFFTASGEKLGVDIVAANTIMVQFLLLAAFALDGFAYAAEALTGEALGAKERTAFYTATIYCGSWIAGTALMISLSIAVLLPWLLPQLSDLAPVQAVFAAQGWCLILLPLAAAPSYFLDGVFIGAGATREMMFCMLFSVFAVYLPCWWLTQTLENTGLWFAFTVFNTARGVSMGLVFARLTLRDRWLSLTPKDREA